MGRLPIGKTAMTGAERVRQHRLRRAGQPVTHSVTNVTERELERLKAENAKLATQCASLEEKARLNTPSPRKQDLPKKYECKMNEHTNKMYLRKTKELNPTAITAKDRYLSPTEANIKKMMVSLENHGQQTAIAVRDEGLPMYDLIAGATRLEAAKRLGWKTIRVDLWNGNDTECRLHEFVENVERRDLTVQQRKEMRAEIVKMQCELFGKVGPGKGGSATCAPEREP